MSQKQMSQVVSALTYLKLGSPDTIFLATAQVPPVPWNVQTPIAEPADSPLAA